MRKLFLPLLLGLVTSSYAVSQVKVICDIDGESVYLDGKYKSDCDSGEPVAILANAGRHTVVVKKNNGDGSYYYFNKHFRIGDGVQKIIEVTSNIHYTEYYYYSKAKKSGNIDDYWTYLEKYPNGRYVRKVKRYIDNYYWNKCDSIDGCKTYLSKVSWGSYSKRAKDKIENIFYQQAKDNYDEPYYSWRYLEKYPRGKYVKSIKNMLDNYYWKNCNSVEKCNEYISKITWGKHIKEAKKRLEDLYFIEAKKKGIEGYLEYVKIHPNGKYTNTLKTILDEFYWNKCNNFYGCKIYISKIPWGVHIEEAKKKMQSYKTSNNGVLPKSLLKGLIAYYKFDGNAKDSSGNHYDGKEYGGIQYVDGVKGKAAKFDGDDDWINIGEEHPLKNIKTHDFTVTLWEKSQVNLSINSNTQSQPFVIKRLNGPCDMFDIGANANYGNYYGKIKVGMSDYRNECWTGAYKYVTLGGVNVNDNKWHFIGVVRKGDILKLFVDGKIISTAKVDNLIIKDGELHFAFQSDYYPNIYKGLIDEVRIYNRALSPTEIKILYELSEGQE